MKINIITLVLVALILFTCSQEDEIPVWSPQNYTDSTFTESRASIYIDSSASVGEELLLHPLSYYKGEAVRVRNQSGWGSFDAIATIYSSESCNIQTVIQNPKNNRSRGFKIYEYSLSLDKCDSIFQAIENQNFYNLPFDLEPDWMMLDGNTYSISYKGSLNKHVVTWQYFGDRMRPLEKERSRIQKKTAERIYHDLFEFSRRPQPCVNFIYDTLRQDSFVYKSNISGGLDFVDSIEYSCSNCRIQYSDYGFNTIIIKSMYDSSGDKILNFDYALFTTEDKKLEAKCTKIIEPEEFD